MWKQIEAFRAASGPLSVVLLMAVLGSLVAAALLKAFETITDLGWALLAVALVLFLLFTSLRAWYNEWKRAESELKRAESLEQEHKDQDRLLESAYARHEEDVSRVARLELTANVLRLLAEYLVLRDSQSGRNLATSLSSYALRMWRGLSDEERNSREHPAVQAHGVIMTYRHGLEQSNTETIEQALRSLAAFYELAHLIPIASSGNPASTSPE